MFLFSDISTKSIVGAIGGDVPFGSDHVDFQLVSNMTVHFGSGEYEKDVTIEINNDEESEFTELFQLCLSNPDDVLIRDFDTALVKILDDDGKTTHNVIWCG